MLLVTDRRWRTATGGLTRRIVESGLVPVEDLDLLARALLAAGSGVYWEAPADCFDGPESVIDGPEGESEETDDSAATGDDDGLVVVAREVPTGVYESREPTQSDLRYVTISLTS